MAEVVEIVNLAFDGLVMLNSACKQFTQRNLAQLTIHLIGKVYRGPSRLVSGVKKAICAAKGQMERAALRDLPVLAVLNYHMAQLKANKMKVFDDTTRTLPSELPYKQGRESSFRKYDSSETESSASDAPDYESSSSSSYDYNALPTTTRQCDEVEYKLMAQMKTRSEKVAEVTERLRVLAQRPTKARIERVLEELDYMEGHLHIAVAGNTGTGKSSFINAIRGLRDSNPSAAKVNYIESTRKITRYAPTSTLCKVVWYDVPGAGTLDVPAATYFIDQGLYIMNAIVILWTDRLTETDVTLMEYCALLKIPCLLVRSKCDLHIANIRDAVEDEVFEANDLHIPINIITEKFAKELLRFRQNTLSLSQKKVRAAYAAAKSQWNPDWSSHIFLVNKKSLYTMIAEEALDKNALDEERFLQHLSKAMAFIEGPSLTQSFAGYCSREEHIFERASKSCAI